MVEINKKALNQLFEDVKETNTDRILMLKNDKILLNGIVIK